MFDYLHFIIASYKLPTEVEQWKFAVTFIKILVITYDEGQIVMTESQIVPLPNLKEILFKQLRMALAENRDKDVILIVDEIILHEFGNPNVYVNKIDALIRLNRWEMAKDFCERIMGLSDESYRFFLDHYLFVLHESGLYTDLIKTYDLGLENGYILKSNNALAALYESAKSLLEDEIQLLMGKLEKARLEENHLAQAGIMAKMKLVNYYDVNFWHSFLNDKLVHPVIKTDILMWAKDNKINQKIKLQKFGQSISVVPTELIDWNRQPTYLHIVKKMESILHQNPVQHGLLLQMFNHYSYVLYPFLISKDEEGILVKALIHMGEVHFNEADDHNTVNHRVQKYVYEINMCHEMFLQVYET